jgi:retron-type reverse transcriptase
MEKLIRTHIIQHMKVNDLFSNKQYGFIAGRSTALQLLEVIDKWSEPLDEGLDIDCIYTDFQKAFDKVPHKRLIKKIENYGITNPILSWIQDFLTRRYQQVSINGETSNQKEVTSGIPQGSVLGPILFVIYINDLPEAVESAAYLFADDTKIFRVINSLDDQHILQNDLVKLENWSDKWLLKFHPEKCKLFTI